MTYQIDSLNIKIRSLESTLNQKDKVIKQLEERLSKGRESLTKVKTEAFDEKEIIKLNDELRKKTIQLSEIESKLEYSNKTQSNLEKKLKNLTTEKEEQLKKIKDLQTDLQSEKRKFEVLKSNSEKEKRHRELEVECLKNKIKSLEIVSSGEKKQDRKVTDFQESIKGNL